MTYEKFKKEHTRSFELRDMISIVKAGRMYFSEEFYRKHLEDYPCVELFYDKKSRTIGLRPQKELTPDGFIIRMQNPKRKTVKSLYLINIEAFLGFYCIDHSKSQRFAPTWNEEEKLWEIKLGEESKVIKISTTKILSGDYFKLGSKE